MTHSNIDATLSISLTFSLSLSLSLRRGTDLLCFMPHFPVPGLKHSRRCVILPWVDHSSVIARSFRVQTSHFWPSPQKTQSMAICHPSLHVCLKEFNVVCLSFFLSLLPFPFLPLKFLYLLVSLRVKPAICCTSLSYISTLGDVSSQ